MSFMILKEAFQKRHFVEQCDSASGDIIYPTLSEVLAEITPLPLEALFLGITNENGLPVILNLHDPVPGPLLVAADKGAGKTAYLKMIAESLKELHDPSDVQYALLTAHPEEWEGAEQVPQCAGVFAFDHNSSNFIHSLAEWAHANKSNQSVVLLINGLEHFAKLDSDAGDILRWFLLRGPARHVWPIATLDANQVANWQTQPLLEFFRTRIYGRTTDRNASYTLTGSNVDFSELTDSQFAMREGQEYLNFWIPRLDE